MNRYDMYAVHEFLLDDDGKTPKSSGLVRPLEERAHNNTVFVQDGRICAHAG